MKGTWERGRGSESESEREPSNEPMSQKTCSHDWQYSELQLLFLCVCFAGSHECPHTLWIPLVPSTHREQERGRLLVSNSHLALDLNRHNYLSIPNLNLDQWLILILTTPPERLINQNCYNDKLMNA